MTTIEQYLLTNKITVYRLVKILGKTPGSYFRLKKKIQGLEPMGYTEYTDMIAKLTAHTGINLAEKFRANKIYVE